MTSQHDAGRFVGADVYASDNSKIGSVGRVYLDARTGQPEWVTVRTGMFGKKETFVPLAQATVSADRVQVPYVKDLVTGAPQIDPDGELSVEEEDHLYTHYDLRRAAPRMDADDYDAPELPGDVEDYVGHNAGETAREPLVARLRRYLPGQ